MNDIAKIAKFYHELDDSQQLKLYKLVLKKTIEGKLTWEQNVCFWTSRNQSLIILYKGENSERNGLSISNRKELATIVINKQQFNILFAVINNKSPKLEYDLKGIDSNEKFFEIQD